MSSYSRRRSARRGKAAVAVLLALALLVGVVWLADGWARSAVEDRVEAAVRENLPELQGTVEAEIGGRLVLPQLIGGSLETATLTSSEATLDGVTLTDVRVVASDLRLRGDRSVGSVDARATVPLETVVAAVERRIDLPDGVTLELRDDEIAAVASVFGVTLEAYVRLVPQPRSITIELDRLVLGGATISASDAPIDLGSLTGATIVDLEVLPDGVELTDVAVTPGGIEVALTGTDVRL